MNFNAGVSVFECNIQTLHKISADNVFELLWLSPVVETENLMIQSSIGQQELLSGRKSKSMEETDCVPICREVGVDSNQGVPVSWDSGSH